MNTELEALLIDLIALFERPSSRRPKDPDMKWYWWVLVIFWMCVAAANTFYGNTDKEQAALLWVIVIVLVGRTKVP